MRRPARLLFGVALVLLLGTSCNGTPSSSPPIADAGGDQTVMVGETVALDGSGSSGENLRFNWAFENRPDGSAAEIENADSSEASLVVDVAGEYLVTLSISNDEGGDTDAVTVTATTSNVGEGTLEPGETYTSEDGVVLGALEGALETALEVAVRGETPPEIPLPESAQALGEFYRLSAAQDTFGADNPFLVALPVPEGADTSSLALALLLEPEDVIDADLDEPAWELLEGVYDPETNTFITTLPFLAAEGRIVVLVSAEGFESPSLSAAPSLSTQQADAKFRARCRRFNGNWNNRGIACSSADEQDLENAVEDAYGDFSGLGFTKPYLGKRIIHVSLFPLEITFGEYIVNLHPYRDVDAGESRWRCGVSPNGSRNSGGYSSSSRLFYVCIGNDGVTAGAIATARHEYFHATQYGYKSVRKSNQTWVKEGTATASEGSLAAMVRDSSRGLHPLDISLTAEDDNEFYEYQAQDFFIYSGLVLSRGLDYFIELFQEGASTGDVDRGLKSLGVNGGLAEMYWDWVKNQSFEKAVDIGSGVLGATCDFNRDAVEADPLETVTYNGASASQGDSYSLGPLTSQVVKLEFGTYSADYEALITVHHSSNDVRVKFFDSADAGTTDCYGDPELPEKIVFVPTGENRMLYALIANTSLTQTQSVTLSIVGQPTLTIIEPEAGSGFDESDTVTFLAEAAGFGDRDDVSISWRYDRHDGVPFIFGSTSSGETLTHSFCDGSYDITAEVLDPSPTGITATVRVVVDDLGFTNPPTECAPSIDIVTPATSGATFALGSSIDFEAIFDDDHPETDEPIYPIIWRDGGQDGLIIARDTLSFSRSKFSEGTQTIYVEYGAASDSVTIEVVDTTNTPPTADITSPADGSQFYWYDFENPGFPEIDFSGTGSDAEDGALSGADLVWSYRQQGETEWLDRGTGEEVSIGFRYYNCGFNSYDIRLVATDSEGLFDLDEIEISILSPPC